MSDGIDQLDFMPDFQKTGGMVPVIAQDVELSVLVERSITVAAVTGFGARGRKAAMFSKSSRSMSIATWIRSC